MMDKIQRAHFFMIITVLFILLWVSTGTVSKAFAQTAPEAFSGWFQTIWVDDFKNPENSYKRYVLRDDEGHLIELDISEDLIRKSGGLSALHLKRVKIEAAPSVGRSLTNAAKQAVSVRVIFPDDQSRDIKNRSMNGPNASALTLSTQAVTGSQPYATILCKFSDIHKNPEKKRYYDELMGPDYPGMDHYFREVSYGSIDLTGSQTFGWYTLPETLAYYTVNQDQLTDDCTAAADSDVYFPNFAGINLMFSDNYGDAARGGALYLTLDGITKAYGVTWIPFASPNHHIVAHEMGHSFGLPHSSGPYGLTYDSDWDVMSGGGIPSFTDSKFGHMGDHTISYHKDKLGWVPSGQKYLALENTLQTITLERLAQPTDGGTAYLMGVIPIDALRYYTVEARQFGGYDDGIPGEAVVIHDIDKSRQNDANVVDPDGNGDVNDDGAMFTVGEVFDDTANNISVSVDSNIGTGFTVTVDRGAAVFPDLEITSLSGPASAAPGGRVSVTGTIVNQGDGGTIGNANTGIYLSVDPVITGDGDDIFLGLVSSGVIVPGASAPLTGNPSVPANIAVGTYYLGAFADYNNLLYEENGEGNNTFLGNMIDIVASPPSVTTGSAYNITDTDATLSGSVNPHAQETDAWFEWGETMVYGSTTPAQAVGNGGDFVGISDVISGLMPGTTYHYRSVAQNATGINYGEDRTFITQAILDVDLITTDMTGPSQVTIGESIDVPVTVYNQGTDIANFFRISIYLSDTPDLTGNFTELYFRGSQGDLPGGQSHLSNFTNISIPPDVPLGNIYLVGKADSYDEVVETDETNNLMADPIEVTAPDLIVTDVEGPNGVKRGDPISGRVWVQNQGNGFTGTNFEVGIFLSTDNIITTADTALGTLTFNAMLGNGGTSQGYNKIVPTNISKGVYYLGAIADSTDVVLESDETNNGGTTNTVRIR